MRKSAVCVIRPHSRNCEMPVVNSLSPTLLPNSTIKSLKEEDIFDKLEDLNTLREMRRTKSASRSQVLVEPLTFISEEDRYETMLLFYEDQQLKQTSKPANARLNTHEL
ncbi:hypothetical protein EIN_031210 [Entamoeba invadens IP1]|uniref:Uncharacterized protein n=1 Tax=Entamoeba invadens IP1 TaxID=370355 RepID=A0A0A1TY51_ENTIV|nr:hypothetical protein EIN_031210 [Entamoeba invadens IP1]ELP86420.1 hypothetical protein EIN_031210 [Entamoeba invadens IP1]|eukprot:XP_004185766.1 hypothetical protein EIN_031210 [Entamoeba invadens IP1]